MSGRKRARETKVTTLPDPGLQRILEFAERHHRKLVLALVLIASIRIIATYTVFNHTADEPAHVACGMEWLAEGAYRWEPQHPPLARITAAIGPYLLGIRPQNTPRTQRFAMFYEGAAILYKDHRYDLTLSLARLGILPWFWLACAAVYWWGLRYFRPATAVAAVFLFSFLPPVLAHGGLATTDMALTATMGASFLAGLIWLDRPTRVNAVWFGAAVGLMTLSKFSAMVFFPASAALAGAWYFYRERPDWSSLKARIPSLGLAVLAGAFVIWAGYRFSFAGGVPAPELFAGIRQLREHNAAGHDGYLLGTRSNQGFWLFFPVALAVKTPLVFLILLAVALILMFRKRPGFALAWIPLAFSAGILLVGLFSRIAIGLRHILPIYVGLSLVVAVALVRLLELSESRKWLRAGLAALVVWFAGSSIVNHPDYIPYFNELAGSEPEKILADSDLDWGQDLKRLSARLKQAGATDVSFPKYIVADLQEHGFPRVHPLQKLNPSVGWNAIGVGLWKESRLVIWPDWIKPHERVGKSILLWYFPPPR